MEILRYKGGLSLNIPTDLIHNKFKLNDYLPLVPDEYQQHKIIRDGVDHYHLTIISSNEKPDKNKIPLYIGELKSDEKLLVLGLGKSKNDAYYLICHFPTGDKIRSQFKLDNKDFHITLGFNIKDDHINRKNITTIIQPSFSGLNQILENKSTNKSKWNQILWDILNLDCTSVLDKLDVPLCDWWYQYLISCANIYKFDIVDANLPTLMEMNPYLGHYIKLKIKLANKSLTKEDLNEAFEELKYINPSDRYSSIVSKLLEIMNHDGVGLDTKTRYYIDTNTNLLSSCHAPRNLTKIDVPGNGTELYASAMVTKNSDTYVRQMGFDLVLNLIESNTRYHRDIPDISYHFPIVDRTPPTMEEAFKLVEIIDNKKKALIHCIGGKGRTNTVVVMYLMWRYRMPLYEAMNVIQNRNIIMSDSQNEFLKQFEKELITRDRGNKTSKNTLDIKHDAIMLIGLPCSGKSTFSNHLVELCSNIVHLNQDEMGRGKYNSSLIEYGKNQIKSNDDKTVLVLDRCNISREDRKIAIDAIRKGNKRANILALWFDISMDELMSRGRLRKNHPVISAKKVPLVIEEKNKNFQEPISSENFQDVIHLKDDEEVNNLLEQWNLPAINLYQDGFFKFPRTRHLHSLGSAERNDLLMDKKEVTGFLGDYVYVEEKIDGANMGISIDGSDYSLKFQNRSHYVNASSHQQFCKLNKWADAFGSQLHSILEPDKHILFGEWMYLKHTVPYDNLPSYFVAFDLYDKTNGKFYARPQLEKLLDGTGIPLVPLIYEGEVKDVKQLLEHINDKSAYGDTNIEGLYCKVPDENKKYYVNRGKIVREGFISDDSKHWTHNTEPNILNMESYV